MDMLKFGFYLFWVPDPASLSRFSDPELSSIFNVRLVSGFIVGLEQFDKHAITHSFYTLNALDPNFYLTNNTTSNFTSTLN